MRLRKQQAEAKEAEALKSSTKKGKAKAEKPT
jgi:hypothetical protein